VKKWGRIIPKEWKASPGMKPKQGKKNAQVKGGELVKRRECMTEPLYYFDGTAFEGAIGIWRRFTFRGKSSDNRLADVEGPKIEKGVALEASCNSRSYGSCDQGSEDEGEKATSKRKRCKKKKERS